VLKVSIIYVVEASMLYHQAFGGMSALDISVSARRAEIHDETIVMLASMKPKCPLR